jgi:hypothetical protein
MTRQNILNALLIASFGAVAVSASAQTYNTPQNAPAGNTAAPPTATTGSTSGATTAPSDSTMKVPGAADSSAPTDMSGYKAARAACDKQPPNSREECRLTVNGRYGALAPKCQKLSGSALDDCLKGADAGQ